MEILIGLLTFFLVLLGPIGVFLPIIPAPFCAWLGYLLCFLCWENGPVGWGLFLFATILTLFAHLFEFVGSYFGAKWFGATWRGGLGALLGSIIGPLLFFFLPIPGGVLLGLVIGPIVGAVAGELLGEREWGDVAKAGFGTVVGGLAAMLVKLLACLLLLAALIFSTAWHLGRPWAEKIWGEAPTASLGLPFAAEENFADSATQITPPASFSFHL